MDIDLTKKGDKDYDKNGGISNVIEEETIPPSYQFRALIRKNASLQSKAWLSNCFQVCIPLVLVCLAGLFQILFNYYVIDAFTAGTQYQTYPTLETFNNGQYTGDNSTNDWDDYILWYSSPTWDLTLGNLTQEGQKQGMLGLIPQLVNTTDPISYSPWYQYYPDEDDMLNLIYDDKQYWTQMQLANLEPLKCYSCPMAANVFNSWDFSADKNSIDYKILIDTQIGPSPFTLEHTMMNMIDTAFLNYATGDNWTIMTWSQPLPYISQAPAFDIGSFLGLLLYPFAVSFVLAIYVNAIVQEKQCRLREMMKMMGLKMVWYWFTNYLWNMFLYFFIIGIMIISSVAFGLRMFTQTSFAIWIIILVGWGNAQVALAFFLSSFFNKARSATIVAYILVIAGVIFSYVLNATIFKDNADNVLAYILFFFYPPFACYRAIYLIGAGCTVYQCPQFSDIEVGGQMFYIMIFLYIDALVYFLVGLYLDAVIPREFGVTKHPLFPLKALQKWINTKRNNSTPEESMKVMLPHNSHEQLSAVEQDEDVAVEADRIRNSQIPPSSPIVICGLKKVYPAKAGTPEKRAVQGLDMHVEKGECFGLLGPNGAGKTTTISILTGLFPPSSGSALIGGYSILEDMDKIHRLMSFCPQFDTVWMELTCIETLLFYARLKGIPHKEEKAHVKEILESVGLVQYGKRRAKALSGGMRRRLSIGISLVGNPRVVFLDEPTTGLDPETRRHLWNVLLRIKQGRCIILTTHSMEEADVLCNRIGIMSRGRLMCLGTQMHLKNKFGQGYTLHANYEEHNQKTVVQFIEDTLPNATQMENLAGNCIYQIPRESFSISSLFEEMEDNKQRVGIVDWGVSQTTMEDVFIGIARRDEADADLDA